MDMNDLKRNRNLAREDLCRRLAACYYQPEAALAEEDVFGVMTRAAAQLDPDLGRTARKLADGFAAQPLPELLLDYTRLFLGPLGILAKPYGSVWLEGEKIVMGDSTMAVLGLYREGGFELDVDFREVPDHIAAELEFLYLLLFQENEVGGKGDGNTLARVRELKRRFLQNHLGRWVGPFTAAVRAGTNTVFYSALADLTEQFVIGEEKGIY
jgi:TorA maturation chaperone TorD